MQQSYSSDDGSTVSNHNDKDSISHSDAQSVASFSVSDATSILTQIHQLLLHLTVRSILTLENTSSQSEIKVSSNYFSVSLEILIPNTGWSGYVLVIDNVDKNLRPSFQRVARSSN